MRGYPLHYGYGYRLGGLWIVGRAIGVLFIAFALLVIAIWSFFDGNGPSPADTSTPTAAASTTGGQ